MTTVFGEVAADYEQIRPEYPISIVPEILDYAGGTPSLVAEIGAGTGKGTALFAQLGAPMLCVEPDPRMAELLAAKFPHAEVVDSDFDHWMPPVGGVPLLAGALMWHLLDAGNRCAKAHAALAQGGVIALIGPTMARHDTANPLSAGGTVHLELRTTLNLGRRAD